MFVSIQNADGVALPISAETEPEVVASTSTLEGKWIADSSKLISYTGGPDDFAMFSRALTEKAEIAQAAYDENSSENPELSCIGQPTPAMIIVSDLYPLEIELNEAEETIAIRSQYFDSERIVYMDGRAHPESGERFFRGPLNRSMGIGYAGRGHSKTLQIIDRLIRAAFHRARRSMLLSATNWRRAVPGWCLSLC